MNSPAKPSPISYNLFYISPRVAGRFSFAVASSGLVLGLLFLVMQEDLDKYWPAVVFPAVAVFVQGWLAAIVYNILAKVFGGRGVILLTPPPASDLAEVNRDHKRCPSCDAAVDKHLSFCPSCDHNF